MSIPFGRDSISHSISLLSLKESRSLWTSLLPLYQIQKKGGRGPLDGSDSPKRDRSQHPRVRSQTHLHPPFMDWRGQAPMSGAGDGSLGWGGCQRVIKGDRLVIFGFVWFWFSFFCERSESTAGEESSDDNWSRGLPLSKGSKSLIGKEILHRPIPIRKRVLLSMKAIFLCHISAYLVLWAIKYPPGGGGPRKRQAIGSFPSSVMSVSLSFFHPCWVAKWAYSRSNSSIIWVGTNIGIQTPLDSIFSFDLHQSGKRRRTHLFHSERPNQATKKKKNWRKFSFHSN